uniref:Major facilitator superfamily (MFS) profile domain-containing protein n=1 Tax=Strombidium rassoulzadegani TaxID=1082188 RepID=A0A7S3CMT4_9SPIT|mmetsp:Transcript_17388/g.29254  ORF Transcript_17388/g.29254 Transcript_17388/m.29254 type:complete len:404 (+) Transcript_17388:883-2094(+)
MHLYYGVLVGLAYEIPQMFSGLYAGSLTKTGNRKMMLISVVAILSMFQFGVGVIDSFFLLAIVRILHGAIGASISPLAFSLVADNFPAERRGTANSILSASNFAGMALSSMSILLIKTLGWRATYCVMGSIGILGAFVAQLVLKNPKRQAEKVAQTVQTQVKEGEREEPKKPKGFKQFISQLGEINQNPVCRNIFIAGFVRSLASVIVTMYQPVFFQKVFPAFKSQYSLLNAAALTLFGFSSSIIGGIICDKFRSKSFMTESLVVIIGHCLCVPMIAIGAFSTNFWCSLAFFSLNVLVSGCYLAPAVTMMQNSTDSSNSGFVVSALAFYGNIASSLSPLFFGFLAQRMGAVANPRIYGYIILAAVIIGYLGSNFFYWRAGKEYTKLMKRKDAERQGSQSLVPA